MKLETFLVLVEDREYKAKNIIEVLEREGIEYIQFKAQNPSLKYISENSDDIDAIILDIGLPLFENSNNYNIDAGKEILQELKRLNFNIPVLICSEQLFHIDEKEYPFVFKTRMFHSYDVETLRKFLKSITEKEQ